MKTLIIIETVHWGQLFSLTYLAAFLIAAGIMIFQGMKKGYPLSSWLLILVTGVVFFIIGDKVFTYSPHQWLRVLTDFRFPVADEKNALGGIIGLFAGIFLARIVLRFNRPVFDNIAVALPVAMAISRIGCLMAGCCYGTPTTLPLGIKYDAASLAYHSQLAQGLIDIHEPGSLAVHPIQLYQMAGCLLIAFIVWRSRRYWKSNGSLFLFSVLCYGFLRYFIEFLCDPASNSFAAPFLWGMNLVQWLIMVAFFPSLVALILRESNTKSQKTNSTPIKVAEFRQVLLTAILCIIVFRGRNWFDFIELSTIMLFFIPVVILLLIEIYRNHSVAGYRLVLPAVLICAISFMAQKSNNAGNTDDKIIFTSAGLIGMAGSYYENVSRVVKEEYTGCLRAQNIGPSKRSFWQTGIDVSHNKWIGRYYKYSIGARGFLGFESGEYTTDYPHSKATFGISPYITFNWQYIGFGTGFSLGQMKLPIGYKSLDSYSEGDIITMDYNNLYFLPSLSLRFGPSDIIYAEGTFPGMFPSTAPYPLFQAGIGSGLGKTNGTKAAIGFCNGIYAQVVYPVKNKVVLEAFYGDNLAPGSMAKRIFSFGIHYRFSTGNKSVVTNNSNTQ